MSDPKKLPPASAANLARIGGHKYGLYFFPDIKAGAGAEAQKRGFATDAHGPFVHPLAIRALVDAGLAAADPTGGAHGSVKITDAGREALKAAAL